MGDVAYEATRLLKCETCERFWIVPQQACECTCVEPADEVWDSWIIDDLLNNDELRHIHEDEAEVLAVKLARWFISATICPQPSVQEARKIVSAFGGVPNR